MAHPTTPHVNADPKSNENCSLSPVGNNRQCCRVVKWLPKTRAVAIGGDDGLIRVYAEFGKEYPPLRSSHKRVFGLFEIEQNIILSCGLDGLLCTWDLFHGPCMIDSIALKVKESLTAIHRTGLNEALVGTETGGLAFVKWNKEHKLDIVHHFQYVHKDRINDIHGYRNIIATVSKDQTGQFWTKGSSLIMLKNIRGRQPFYSVRVSSRFIAVGSKNFIHLYENNAPTFNIITNIHVHPGVVWSLQFVSDEIIIVGVGAILSFISTRRRNNMLATIETPARFIQDFDICPCGTVIVVGAGKGANTFVKVPDKIAEHVKNCANAMDTGELVENTPMLEQIVQQSNSHQVQKFIPSAKAAEFVPSTITQPVSQKAESFIIPSEFERFQMAAGQTPVQGCDDQNTSFNNIDFAHVPEISITGPQNHLRPIGEADQQAIQGQHVRRSNIDLGTENLVSFEMESVTNAGTSSTEKNIAEEEMNSSFRVVKENEDEMNSTSTVVKRNEESEDVPKVTDSAKVDARGSSHNSDIELSSETVEVHEASNEANKYREEFSLVACMYWMSRWRTGKINLEWLLEMDSEALSGVISAFIVLESDKWKELYHPIRKSILEVIETEILMASDIVGHKSINRSVLAVTMEAVLIKNKAIGENSNLLSRLKQFLAQFS